MQYLLHVVLLPLVFSELPLTHTSASYDGKLRNATDGTIEAYMIPPFKSSHASFIEPCPNGDLVAIVISRLPKGSIQWTKATVVSQRKHYSNQNPVLFFDNATNVLYLFHSQQEAKKEIEYSGEETATIWELQSTDFGVTWSSPRIMFARAGSFDRNRVVFSLKNTWLYPIYYAGGSRKDTSYIKENTDHKVFDKWLEHYFTDSEHLVQPTVERPNANSTKLMSFFRDRRAQYIYRATSSDDGVTWSKPTKTKLPNNNSGIQATVLMSGHIAIVYNPTNHIRNPLVISVSEDEWLSWIHTRILEYAKETDEVEFSYPTLFQDASGRIHVSYTYKRETIKYKLIPNEAWISKRI